MSEREPSQMHVWDIDQLKKLKLQLNDGSDTSMRAVLNAVLDDMIVGRERELDLADAEEIHESPISVPAPAPNWHEKPSPSFQYRGVDVKYIDGIGGSIWKNLQQSRWYEQPMLEYISSLNREGIYLDVGANIGNHSIYFAMFCKSTRVIGIEALPRHVRLATEFVEANNLAHKATILPVAVGAQTGFLDAIHQVVNGQPRSFNALCVKIDDIAPSGVTVIKMDIEGAEPSALKGALKTLERDKPLLFIEAGTDEDLAEVEAVLGSTGYKRTGKVFNATPTYEFAAG